MKNGNLDVEMLQKVLFERSKWWATTLEEITLSETLEDIALDDIVQFHGTECENYDDDDELSSMEDSNCEDTAENLNFLKNITNTGILYQGTRRRRSEEQNQVIDCFNQTVPIFNECHRQLKEFGLDKILKSFDKKQIEEKVGGWLNRHNSLYGGDNTLLYDRGGKIEKYEKGIKSTQEIPDSDDSLQSGETARYIRSCRIGTMKKTASTTTIIKTHKVKSRREALRGKYDCETNDDYDHLEVMHHRKKVTDQQSCANHYDMKKLYKSRVHGLKQRRKVFRKRTCSISCSTESSSETDSCYKDDLRSHPTHLKVARHRCSSAKSVGKSQRSKGHKMIMPSSRIERIYYYTHCLTHSFSSSSAPSPFNSVMKRRKKIQRNAFKRESDCHCCNENELCDEYVHIADTSTGGEWSVENCCSPKKKLKVLLPKTLAYNYKMLSPATTTSAHNGLKTKIKTNDDKYNLVKQTSENYSDMSTIDCCSKNYSSLKKFGNITTDKDLKSEACFGKKKSLKTVILDENFKLKENNNKPTREISSKAKTETAAANISLEDEFEDETEVSDWELKKALKLSKKLYKEEQRNMEKEKDKQKQKQKKIERKPLKKEKVSKATEKTYQKSKTKNMNVAIEDNEESKKICKFNEQDNNKEEVSQSHGIEMSKMKNLNCETYVNDESLFTSTQVICNSTAMSTKSKAYNRQIFDQLVEEDDEFATVIERPKPTRIENRSKSSNRMSKLIAEEVVAPASTTVTSTTLRFPDRDIKLASKDFVINDVEPNNEVICVDHIDSPLITSTTNVEQSSPNIINGNLEKTQPKPTTSTKNSTNNQSLQDAGVLIYTPELRNRLPANSFTSDGSFTVTEKHLRTIVGERVAKKFIKYYVGCKRFDANSTVYFRPPPNGVTPNNSSESLLSDSSDDLEYFGQCGDLYAITN